MEEELRRSKRRITIRREPGFIYEEECVSSILRRSAEINDTWQPLRSSSEVENSLFNSAVNDDNANVDNDLLDNWSESNNLPVYFNTDFYSLQNSESEVAIQPSLSQSENSNTNEYERECVVGGASEVNKVCVHEKYRRNSSTRLDFLDPFLNRDRLLTVSSTERIDTSDMASDSEENDASMGRGGCKNSDSSSKGRPAATENAIEMLGNAMTEMLGKLDMLTQKVTSLSGCINDQGARIESLEVALEGANSEDRGSEGSTSAAERPRSPKDRPEKVKKLNKKEIVLDERERQYQMLLEKWLEKDKKGGKSNFESSQESPSEEESSRKKKKLKSPKVPSSPKKPKSLDPGDDPSDSPSSGSSDKDSDSESSRRSKRKVKSGAKVKKRPVLKTELWPHTIANEQDGEGDEVTSENIILTKFLSCFSYIMINAKDKSEAAGRSVLLHAVTSVFECVPWTEARNFHNITMVQIEQKKLDWTSDFTALGKEYVDRKVRLNFRSKVSSAGSNSSNKAHNGSSYGRGSNLSSSNFNSNSRYSNDRFNSMFALICHQWNTGTCSYGVNCKRWHTCKSCAEAGRIGEKHQACRCPHSSFRPRQNGQPG